MHAPIAILGDLHIGASKSSVEFHDHFNEFFKEFFSYIDSANIKHVIQVGDMFDVRQYVTTYAIDFVKKKFIQECIARDLKVLVLVGNHDAFYKEKISLNTVTEIVSGYPGFTVVDSPRDVFFAESTFAIFPWICNETREATESLIKTSKAKIAFGHFEFGGFEYQKGTVATSGASHKDYSKFDLVVSGHYHTKSKIDNVQYTGTPYQLTWIDYNDAKGFWVLKEEQLEFVRNSNDMFRVFEYPELVTEEDVRGHKCRIRVKSSEAKTKEFLKWKDAICASSPYGDVKVIETQDVVETTEVDKIEEVVFRPSTTIDRVKLFVTTVTDDKAKQNKLLEEVKSILEEVEGHHDLG